MTIHPAAPLTPENEPHYRALDEAKLLLTQTTDAVQRIKLILAIGESSSKIMQQLRNGQAQEVDRLRKIINEQREQIAVLRKQIEDLQHDAP